MPGWWSFSQCPEVLLQQLCQIVVLPRHHEHIFRCDVLSTGVSGKGLEVLTERHRLVVRELDQGRRELGSRSDSGAVIEPIGLFLHDL